MVASLAQINNLTLRSNDAEVVESEPAIDPLMVDWRKVSCEKNIAEVAHSSSDLGEVDKSEDESGETDD